MHLQKNTKFTRLAFSFATRNKAQMGMCRTISIYCIEFHNQGYQRLLLVMPRGHIATIEVDINFICGNKATT